MAKRTFLPHSRISAIADTLLLVGCLIFFFHATAAKSPSTRIDDGGITVPPALPLASRQVLAIKNRPLTLHCPIIISSDARVFDLWWVKDGSKLDLNPQNPTTSDDAVTPPSRISITDDGDLHFEKIIYKIGISRSASDSNVGSRHGKNYTDEGEYRCIVKTAIGVVFSPIITVSVAALEVREENVEVRVKAGQPVVILECQIASTPPLALTSSHVTWQYGRTNISRLAQESNRFSILASGTLVIFGVQVADAGIYRCFARHDVLNTNKSADIKLIVETTNELVSTTQEPPKFLFASDYEVQKTLILDEEDEEQTLDCVASGMPSPSVTWILTYDIANESHVQPFSKILKEGKAFHDSITLTSESAIQGNYTCVVRNSIGSPISKTIPVVRLPALIKGPNSYKHPPAKTVRFECKVPPTYTLVWYKDGQRLETGSQGVGRGRVKAKGNEIVISNTIRNDSGFYQCEVVSDNHNVYAIGTARLSIENNRQTPDAPYDLQCIHSQAKALIISWELGSRDNITAFTIHYMPIGGEERQKVTPSKHTEFTIDNLKPYTNYSIYVRSYSVKSASAQSQKVICATNEDVPVKAPSVFIFERYGPSTQVRIRWRPLSDTEARGRVIFYKLQWRSIEGDFTNVRYIDGDSDEFLITELTPGEPYELRLLPSTSAGWPLDKESIPWHRVNSTNFDTNVTFPEGYYAAPTMDLTVLNSSSILVNWIEPPRPKELSVKGYRLTYSTEVRKIEDFVFFGPFIHVYDYSDRTYLFTNFAPSTSYEVHLQTFGEINLQSWESEVTSRFIRTFSASNEDNMSSSKVLPAISGLQVFPLSSSEVRLTWEVPKSLNPQLHYYYTVRYNKLDDNDYRYISSTSESIEIKNLEPYTPYEFSVQLMGDEQGGPFSQKIESRTLPGLPGEVVLLHWRVLNQSLVEVEWQPPTASNGVIMKYYVQYRHKNASVASQGEESGSGANDTSWKSKVTKNTSLFLEDLLKNEEYLVRVIAETKAGLGQPSEVIFVRIFIRKPTSPEPTGDGPSITNTLQTTEPSSTLHLGIVIGVSLSVMFIIICIVIILSRHRLFPMLTRQPVGMHVNGNGFPPRAKRSVESFNGVEMKVLESLTANDQLLDTKGGHIHQNGMIPGPTVNDPLLMRIVRNPIDDPHGPDDEESVPNCIH